MKFLLESKLKNIIEESQGNSSQNDSNITKDKDDEVCEVSEESQMFSKIDRGSRIPRSTNRLSHNQHLRFICMYFFSKFEKNRTKRKVALG